MSMKQLQSWKPDRAPVSTILERAHTSQSHFHSPISRRDMMKGAAGLGVAGAAGALFGGWRTESALAAGPGPGVPNPIPGGLDIGGTLFHVKLPGLVHPADDEPATITDFNGAVAYTVIDGMGTRTNLATGETQQLPFEVDMRFMKGVFVGTDGRVHRGAFGLL